MIGVLEGRERPVRGNLRSVWYRELRAVLFRLKLLEYNDDPGDDSSVEEVRLGKPTYRGAYLLDLMEDAFQQMFLAGHPEPEDPVHRFVMARVARTGGSHGEPYGIHVDHAEPHLVLEAFERWLKDRAVRPLETD